MCVDVVRALLPTPLGTPPARPPPSAAADTGAPVSGGLQHDSPDGAGCGAHVALEAVDGRLGCGLRHAHLDSMHPRPRRVTVRAVHGVHKPVHDGQQLWRAAQGDATFSVPRRRTPPGAATPRRPRNACDAPARPLVCVPASRPRRRHGTACGAPPAPGPRRRLTPPGGPPERWPPEPRRGGPAGCPAMLAAVPRLRRGSTPAELTTKHPTTAGQPALHLPRPPRPVAAVRVMSTPRGRRACQTRGWSRDSGHVECRQHLPSTASQRSPRPACRAQPTAASAQAPRRASHRPLEAAQHPPYSSGQGAV